MRSTVIALTAALLAPTAAMASVASGELRAAIQKPQIVPGDAAADQRGSSRGNLILAKGDQSGTGPGVGGQKGQKKGGHKGKQAEGKDHPNKKR